MRTKRETAKSLRPRGEAMRDRARRSHGQPYLANIQTSDAVMVAMSVSAKEEGGGEVWEERKWE